MHRTLPRAAAAALAVALLGAPGPAYLVRATAGGDAIRWNLESSAPNVQDGKVTFYVDGRGVQDVSVAQFGDAVRAAVGAWEDVPQSAVAFAEDDSRPATRRSATDRVNRFGFTPGVIPPFAFASAFTYISGSRILDVDVVFNPDMGWSVQSPGSGSLADLQGVAAHEWGHGIGLDHVPLSRSTMYYAASYGAVSLRSLETDDAAAAADSYPEPTLGTALGTLAGRVDVAGATDERGIQVTAVDFATNLPAASAFTAPDGDYAIRGLPPGVYRVVASPIGTASVRDGVYSPWWDSAATGILPAVRGQDGAADGSTGVHVLAAGQVLSGVDLSVAAAASPFEPNDTLAAATPVAPGRSLAGRIEDNNDVDVFSFPGTAGRRVSIFLHAQQIGSDLDPRIYLRRSDGTLLASSADISLAYTSPGGGDLDCRIVDVALPATATYYVAVEAESAPDASRIEDFFYVLTVLDGGGVPSPYTSRFTASPPVVLADGATTSLLVLEPRSLSGTLVGPGRSVSFQIVPDASPDGALSPVADEGDGTYTATVTSAVAPGGDVVRAFVDGAEVATATVTYRGPADFDASSFHASPRRIRYDGAARTVITLVPRDVNGVPAGAGQDVHIELAGSFDAGLGPTADRGDGSYAATLTAGTTEQEVRLSAEVDGRGLGGTLAVDLGFPLEEVVDDAVADLTRALSDSPPAKSRAKLTRARDLLAGVGGLPAGVDSARILAGVRSALAALEAAGRRGADTEALGRELAEAARQAAARTILWASQSGGDVSRAQALFDAGETLLDGGRWSRAAARYRAALVRAARTVL